jgi:hypothetical protein
VQNKKINVLFIFGNDVFVFMGGLLLDFFAAVTNLDLILMNKERDSCL